jgi:hypothetical protein
MPGQPEDVQFIVGGVKRVGRLRSPAVGAERLAAFVVTGPPAASAQMIEEYADKFAAAGYVTLTLIPAAEHAAGDEPATSGGLRDGQADIRAAVELLIRRPDVDADQIGVVGVCLGRANVFPANVLPRRIPPHPDATTW